MWRGGAGTIPRCELYIFEDMRRGELLEKLAWFGGQEAVEGAELTMMMRVTMEVCRQRVIDARTDGMSAHASLKNNTAEADDRRQAMRCYYTE